MATTRKTPAKDAKGPQAPDVAAPKTAPAPEPAPVYSRDELLAAATAFGVSRELMAGALRHANLESATRAQAEAALSRFQKLEV